MSSAAWPNVQEFKKAARDWAERIRVTPVRIQVRDMTRKWASCSANGVLTFSSDLLQLDRDFGEAVIVHELVHLAVPNHGPLFKSLVRAHLPAADMVVESRNGHFSQLLPSSEVDSI